MDEQKFLQILNEAMGKVLDLAQSSLPEFQFQAFRKLALNIFGEARRRLNLEGKGKGWCGNMQNNSKEAVPMDEQ